MITLLTIWGWLLFGAAIGRVLFVRVLGDEPRRGLTRETYRLGRRVLVEDGWTGAFMRAIVAAVACIIAWPIALPVALMLARTGTEKLRARRERLAERLAAEVARLEKEASDA